MFSPKQAEYKVIRVLSDVCTGLWIDFLSSSVPSAPFVMKVNTVDAVGYGTAPTVAALFKLEGCAFNNIFVRLSSDGCRNLMK